jgi:hypothetical protein
VLLMGWLFGWLFQPALLALIHTANLSHGLSINVAKKMRSDCKCQGYSEAH